MRNYLLYIHIILIKFKLTFCNPDDFSSHSLDILLFMGRQNSVNISKIGQ